VFSVSPWDIIYEDKRSQDAVSYHIEKDEVKSFNEDKELNIF